MQSDLGEGKRRRVMGYRTRTGMVGGGFSATNFRRETEERGKRALREKPVFLVDPLSHGVSEPRLVKTEYGQTMIFNLSRVSLGTLLVGTFSTKSISSCC